MTRPQKARLLMLVTVAVWGATFVLVRDALADISPLLFNAIRMTIAFLCLAVAYRREWSRLTARAWRAGAIIGLFLAIGYEFQTVGLGLTTAAKSAFLTSLTVVLVPLLARIPWLRRKGAPAPRWNLWLGALLALLGILLLTVPAPLSREDSVIHQLATVNRGDLLTLACALGFALQIIAQDHFSRTEPATSQSAPGQKQCSRSREVPPVPFVQLALLQIGFAALYLCVTAPVLERPSLHLSFRVILALGVTSVLATAAAFSIQSWAQQILAPAHLVLILALEPVFAWITSLAVLGERLSLRDSLGALLILAGIAAAEWIHAPAQPTQRAS